MSYSAQTTFAAPAQAYPQLWRVFLGLILITVVCTAWTIVLFLAVHFVAGENGLAEWSNMMLEANGPTSVLLVLSMLWGLGLGTVLATKLLHGRGWRSLLGPHMRFLKHFGIVTGLCWAVVAVLAFLPFGPVPEGNLDPVIWATFLPLSLVVILGQTGAEELLFRGYLQQQLSARFNSPIIWMVLPSLAFGALHFDPTAAPQIMWLVVLATTVFGLCAADLTARTGTLGAAWGFHFANNVIAILFVSVDDTLSGLSLFVLPISRMDTDILLPLMLADIGVTIGIWVLARFALRRTAR